MEKIKILTRKVGTEVDIRLMEELINNHRADGYKRDGDLTTYDRWEDEIEDPITMKKTGRRIQVTYFMQIMIRDSY